jgi:threonine dehydratase
VIDIDAADFELKSNKLCLKLELLQHSGSFKARGAFANLLTRKVPEAGVVAASGGNHGAAVAYAARTLKVPAKIFVPTVSSPPSGIRDYGADLVIEGDRYADALAASEAWMKKAGAMSVQYYDLGETILGRHRRHGADEQAPDIDTPWFPSAWRTDRGIAAGGPLKSSVLSRLHPRNWRGALDAGHPVDAEAEVWRRIAGASPSSATSSFHRQRSCAWCALCG